MAGSMQPLADFDAIGRFAVTNDHPGEGFNV